MVSVLVDDARREERAGNWSGAARRYDNILAQYGDNGRVWMAR